MPARRHVEAADDVHQRRLARAGGPHDRDVLTALDDQVDPVDGAHDGVAAAVDLRHRVQLDDRRVIRRLHLRREPIVGLSRRTVGRTSWSPSLTPPVISVVVSPTRPMSTGTTTFWVPRRDDDRVPVADRRDRRRRRDQHAGLRSGRDRQTGRVARTPTPGGAVASETCTGYCTTLLVSVLCGVICVTVPSAVAFVAGNVMCAGWPSCTFAASASSMLAVTASWLGLAITTKPLPDDVAGLIADTEFELLPPLVIVPLVLDKPLLPPVETSPTLFAIDSTFPSCGASSVVSLTPRWAVSTVTCAAVDVRPGPVRSARGSAGAGRPAPAAARP